MENKQNLTAKPNKDFCEQSKDFTPSEILYLLGETMLMEIDEKAEIQYGGGEEPNHFFFQTPNGKTITVFVTDIAFQCVRDAFEGEAERQGINTIDDVVDIIKAMRSENK